MARLDKDLPTHTHCHKYADFVTGNGAVPTSLSDMSGKQVLSTYAFIYRYIIFHIPS